MAPSESKPVCVVAGVGPGNGAALARKFAAEGHAVALLARNEAYLEELAAQIETGKSYPCDLSDRRAIETTFKRIDKEMGPVETLVYNAGSGMFAHVEDTPYDAFEIAWRINAMGCLVAARQVIPGMSARGRGNIAIIGATASLRGGANFTAFASAKAAQRNLAQSMARHLGPRGIHVSYLIIDGVIDIPRTREMIPDQPDDFFLQPEHIAETVFNVTRQPKSAWTFELDVRPFGEKW